jgi:hypothetical protein
MKSGLILASKAFEHVFRKNNSCESKTDWHATLAARLKSAYTTSVVRKEGSNFFGMSNL